MNKIKKTPLDNFIHFMYQVYTDKYLKPMFIEPAYGKELQDFHKQYDKAIELYKRDPMFHAVVNMAIDLSKGI